MAMPRPSERTGSAGVPVRYTEVPGAPGTAVATPFPVVICRGCDQLFTPERKDQLHHDEKCRYRAYERDNPRITKANKQQLELALKARDKGVERVKGRNHEFVKTMREVAVKIAQTRPDKTITADDLREWHRQNPQIGEPSHKNTWGSIFCRNPDFEFVDYTKSTQIQGHGNLIRRWVLAANEKLRREL